MLRLAKGFVRTGGIGGSQPGSGQTGAERPVRTGLALSVTMTGVLDTTNRPARPVGAFSFSLTPDGHIEAMRHYQDGYLHGPDGWRPVLSVRCADNRVAFEAHRNNRMPCPGRPGPGTRRLDRLRAAGIPPDCNQGRAGFCW